VADPIKTSSLPRCANTSNLVVLRPRVHMQIEGNPKYWGALSRAIIVTKMKMRTKMIAIRLLKLKLELKYSKKN